MFTHLHVHSNYSLLDGMCDIKKLVERVGSLGQEAIAITDHGTLHTPVKLLSACKKYEEKTGKKIKPIYGIELYVTPDIKDNLFVAEKVKEAQAIRRALKPKDKKDFLIPTKIRDYYHYLAQTDEAYFGNSTKEFVEDIDSEDVEDYKYGLSHLVVLAKNNDGFQNLLKIASISQLEGFYNRPRVDHAVLERYGKNLIALSACRAGEIPRLIFRDREDLAIQLINKYKSIFDEFYLELQPPVVPEQEFLNKVLIRLAEETDTPLIVTTDVHYILESESVAHEELMKMQTNGKFWFKEKSYFLHSEEEIRAYGFPEEAITNTNKIAEQCNVTLDMSQKIPALEETPGYTNNELITKITTEFLNDYLSKNPDLDPIVYHDRLKFELDVILSKHFADYLLIISDILTFAKNQGILIGPGRGSSGGSLVCMGLGITNIDPIKYGLLFQRFISLDRPSAPDIDSDTAEFIPYPEQYSYLFKSGRQQMIEYMASRYGEDNISQIVAFGTLSTRLILKDVARLFGMDHNEINEINKFIPSDAGFQWKISDCLFGDEQDNKTPIPEIVDYYNKHPRLFETAMELEGNPRHTSVHAAGVILAPSDVTNYVPLMRGKEGEHVSQWDMKDLENAGLLKIDLLGLKTLGVVDRTNTMIKARHGITVDYYSINREDPKALALIKAGNTKGVFQVESDGMSAIFRQLNKVSFEDIVAVLSLYRPGPIAFVDSYIRRANKQERVSYLFPELEPILKDTYGIMLYQESIMAIVVECAGFSKGQSDIYRKVIGKKLINEVDEYNKWLVYGNEKENIPGLIKNGIPEDKALQLADDLVAFAKYSFNKAHAVAYAINTVSTAWYKAHYPIEYMTALLSSSIGNRDKIKLYIEDLAYNNIPLLPPSINHSEYEFSAEGNGVRYGFGAIKDVGFTAIEIVQERQRNGPYKSIEDLINRNDKANRNKKNLTAFILSGACDEFSKEPNLPKRRRDLLREAYTKANLKFSEEDIALTAEESTAKNYLSEKTKEKFHFKQIEVDFLGTVFGEHPLAEHTEEVDWNDSRITATVLIEAVLSKITKRGDPYLLIEIDHLGTKQTIFLFRNLEKLASKLVEGGIRIMDIERTTNIRGSSYILRDCKYYREEGA